MADDMETELSDELTAEEVEAIDLKHKGHSTCVRIFLDGDPHQYCEDCAEAMYFVEFNGFNSIAQFIVDKES